MPEEKEKNILDQLAEEFEKEAYNYIELQLLSGSEEEEATEQARQTVSAVISYCVDQAKQYAKTPKEFEKEFKECINEWYSVLLLITNKPLKKILKNFSKKSK